MKQITTIYFDAGGVLFDTETSKEHKIKRLLKSKGFKDKEINYAYKLGEEFFNKIKEYKWLERLQDEEEFFGKYYEIIANALPTPDPYSLKMQLFHHIHFANHCVLFPEVETILQSLHGKYKLGVISNAFPSMDWIFDYLDIRKYFDAIILSSKVGSSKPDRIIYQKALDALKSKPSETIFIDDKVGNVEGAKTLGITGIHLDRNIDDLNIIYKYL